MTSRLGSSRRRLLQVAGAGLAVAVAGCSSGDSDDSDGTPSNDTQNDSEDGSTDGDESVTLQEFDTPGEMTLAGTGSEPFRGWLLPGFTEQIDVGELLCQFENYGALSSGSQSRVARQREFVADLLGVESSVLSWGLGVGSAPSGQLGWIYRGSFDRQAVRSHLENTRNVYYAGALEEYEVLETDSEYAVAVGENTVIEHPSYDAFVAAEQGERELLAETDESAALALDLLPDGLRILLTRQTESPELDVFGTSFQAYENGQPTQRTSTFVFSEAGSATLETARSILGDRGIDPTVEAAEAAGRTLLLQYRA